MNFQILSETILKAHHATCENALRQINLNLTIRNWLIGHFIVEYELKGDDRAAYGQQLYKSLAKTLKVSGLKGLSLTMLHTCKQFYLTYPQIFQSVTEKLQYADNQSIMIFQSVTEKFKLVEETVLVQGVEVQEEIVEDYGLRPEILVSRLSFTHFVELMRVEDHLKRAFYEIQTIKNNWSVRQLEREIGTHLFERVGMSQKKEEVLAKACDAIRLQAEDLVKSPYVLDFLGFPEGQEISEESLEAAIVAHLQNFLMELGRGFCFEARQKRITIDNEHFYVDLVFYHRILKCHVLFDLKLRKFCHSDASQMNTYIHYYKENEMTEGDKDPIGIILCTDKNEALVRYATGGMTSDLFVSKYLIELPSVEELRRIVLRERQRFEESHGDRKGRS